MKRCYVRELDCLLALSRQGEQLSHAVVQGLDLREADIEWSAMRCTGTVFLGCQFPEKIGMEFLAERVRLGLGFGRTQSQIGSALGPQIAFVECSAHLPQK